MEERLESILSSVDESEIATIASKSLEKASAILSTPTAFSEITTPHNDLRTIGIVRATGNATVGGVEVPWSAVVKVIDPAADGGTAAFWVYPEQEEVIYEHGLFSNDGLPFRPARCYEVTRLESNLKLLWLEDLSEAGSPPFDLPQMESLANHVGRFNGFHANRFPELPFKPARDSYLTRWDGTGNSSRVPELLEIKEHEYTRAMYANVPVEAAIELCELLDRNNRELVEFQHSLSFGDCQPGNLFQLNGETVAIDWASVTIDPLGVDAGVLAGSGMTWGKRVVEAAQNERSVFDAYIGGLRQSGWSGDADMARRGFFGQFGTYLIGIATVPITFAVPGQVFRKEFVEERFQTQWDEIPKLLSGIAELYPSYVDELHSLLD